MVAAAVLLTFVHKISFCFFTKLMDRVINVACLTNSQEEVPEQLFIAVCSVLPKHPEITSHFRIPFHL
jgi:hypothetical protein